MLYLETGTSHYPALSASNVTHIELHPYAICDWDATVFDRAETFSAASHRLQSLTMHARTNFHPFCSLAQPTMQSLTRVQLSRVVLRSGLSTFAGMSSLVVLTLCTVLVSEPCAPALPLPTSLLDLFVSSDDVLPDIVAPFGLTSLSIYSGHEWGGTHHPTVRITGAGLTALHLSRVNTAGMPLAKLTALQQFSLSAAHAPLYSTVARELASLPALDVMVFVVLAGRGEYYNDLLHAQVMNMLEGVMSFKGRARDRRSMVPMVTTEKVWGISGWQVEFIGPLCGDRQSMTFRRLR